MIITIDGPVASGKSSVACEIAKKLNFYYLNSGFLYRALAYLLIYMHGYEQEMLSTITVEQLETYISIQKLVYTFDIESGSCIFFDEIDITPYLKDKKIDQAASIISSNKQVRHLLIELQRSIGRTHDIVADGRDMGSVIFPYADFKFYLTADLEVRTQRWVIDQQKRGNSVSIEDAIKQLQERDIRDQNRKVAPLIIPEGAIVIDNSQMNYEQVIQMVFEYIKKGTL